MLEFNKNFCSRELSEKLKDIGVKQDGSYVWLKSDYKKEKYSIVFASKRIKEKYDFPSAFTVAELGEMLRKGMNGKIILQAKEQIRQLALKINSMEDEADSRAKMLAYLIENNLIKI